VATDNVRARFDPKVQLYIWLQIAGLMCATLFGVLALPLWILIGPYWAPRYFATIEARLGARSIEYVHGIWFRSELSIPLDKIQDVSLHHGPILDALGLATLKIETAGGGQTGSGAVLHGIVGAAEFRSAILARRDALTASAHAPLVEAELLREIRDALHRIEARMASDTR
jgi:uncharacterized membrane protein YdbT with pleckstrin-like domain